MTINIIDSVFFHNHVCPPPFTTVSVHHHHHRLVYDHYCRLRPQPPSSSLSTTVFIAVFVLGHCLRLYLPPSPTIVTCSSIIFVCLCPSFSLFPSTTTITVFVHDYRLSSSFSTVSHRLSSSSYSSTHSPTNLFWKISSITMLYTSINTIHPEISKTENIHHIIQRHALVTKYICD